MALSRRRNLLPLLVTLFWVLLFPGCALKTSYERTDPSPESMIDLWNQIIVNENEALTFRSTARVILESEGQRLVQRGALAVKPPASIRVEVSPPIGLPQLFLLMDDHSILVYIPQQRTAYLGQSSPDNLANFLGMGLPVRQLASALIGGALPLADGESINKVSREGNYHRLDIHTNNVLSRSFWIDADNRHLRRIDVFDRGETIHSLTFGNHRILGQRSIPHLIEITQEKPSWAKLTIEYRDSDLSADHSDFKFVLPAGVRIEKLESPSTGFP